MTEEVYPPNIDFIERWTAEMIAAFVRQHNVLSNVHEEMALFYSAQCNLITRELQ